MIFVAFFSILCAEAQIVYVLAFMFVKKCIVCSSISHYAFYTVCRGHDIFENLKNRIAIVLIATLAAEYKTLGGCRKVSGGGGSFQCSAIDSTAKRWCSEAGSERSDGV